MILNISFRHMESSDSLKEFIELKSKILKKYFRGQISATWSLSIEKQGCIAHCHLVGNNMDYFGESTTQEFKSSIEIALDKIKKQVQRHKEIVKDNAK